MGVDGRHEVVEEGGLGVEETDAVEGPAEMPVRGVQEPHDAAPPRMCPAPRRRFPFVRAPRYPERGRGGGPSTGERATGRAPGAPAAPRPVRGAAHGASLTSRHVRRVT
ncbi:hypothetical protein GCM10010275_45420 [Streptomyces litmocidini]|nr:hypothetical protein GCM10010275_45420 [Streptomyces litmocidini]